MIAKYIDKRVYLARIITAKGNEIKFTILAQDLESALAIVKSHESYGFAVSLSIKPRHGHCFMAVEDETNPADMRVGL